MKTMPRRAVLLTACATALALGWILISLRGKGSPAHREPSKARFTQNHDDRPADLAPNRIQEKPLDEPAGSGELAQWLGGIATDAVSVPTPAKWTPHIVRRTESPDRPIVLKVEPKEPLHLKYDLLSVGSRDGETVRTVKGEEAVTVSPQKQAGRYQRTRRLQWTANFRPWDNERSQILDLPPTSVVSATHDARNRVLETDRKTSRTNVVRHKTGEMRNPGEIHVFFYEHPFLPEGEVRNGAVWKDVHTWASSPARNGQQGGQGKPEPGQVFRYKVMGFATVNGVDTVIIRRQHDQQRSESIVSDKNDTYYANVDDGMIEYAEMRWSVTYKQRRRLESVLCVKRRR